MSVAVCRASFADILVPPAAVSSSSMAWLLPPRQHEVSFEPDQKVEDDDKPGQLDIWSSIQAAKNAVAEVVVAPPYVHPLFRRSSSSLSQNSLETCTESLGSETGSDVFSDKMDFPFFTNKDDEDESKKEMEYEDEDEEAKELKMVNYHCSIGRRTSPPRQFPPPLPSISRRDGPCLSMRPHRREGRLVVEAVPVASQSYLQAERHDGRLLISFINTSAEAAASVVQPQQQEEEEEEEEEFADHVELVEGDVVAEEEEEEEEEVEVVERGTVVEVKVSGGAASKVLRSTLVINKFVGAIPLGDQQRWAKTDHQQQTTNELKEECEQPSPPQQRSATLPLRRIPSSISTTAAVAAVAETALSATGSSDVRNYGRLPDNKVLFTSKRRNREELLHNMRRCSQLRRPLFIWEPYCIATSS